MLNPFSVANSCQQCPAGTGPVSSNDDTQWIDECPADAAAPSSAADAATPSSAAGAATPSSAADAATLSSPKTEVNESNSDSIHAVMIGVMIAFVIVIFSNAW
jgi:hypothetical protein